MNEKPGFIRCPFREVMETPGLTDGERLLLAVIWTLSADKGYCWAKVQTLAQLTGTNARQVQRRKAALEKAGCIRVDHEAGKPDKLVPLQVGPTQPLTECVTLTDCDRVTESDTLPPTESVTQPPTECDTHTLKQKYKQKEKQKGAGVQCQKPKKQEEDSFTRFYQAYPRHAGKAAAQKAWDKLRPDEALLSQMLAALEWQRASPGWTKDGGQYIPYPATWLNQRRWEDERPDQAQPRNEPAGERARRPVYDAHGNVVRWE